MDDQSSARPSPRPPSAWLALVTSNNESTSDSPSPVQEFIPRPSTFPVIESLLNACIKMLRRLIRAIKSTDEASKEALMLTRAAETLVLWGDRHQVFNGTLDKELNKSKKIRRITILSLRLIARNISQGTRSKLFEKAKLKIDGTVRDDYDDGFSLDYDNGFEVEDEDNDDLSDEEDDGLTSSLEELDSYIRCLVDLDSVLSNPVLDPEAIVNTEQQQFISLGAHHQFYLRIRGMFNDISEDIANHLGRANFRRYQQLSELRKKVAYEREREQVDQEGLVQNSLDLLPMAKSSRISNPETEALRDSGLGTSTQTKSFYAKSALSSNVSAMSDGKHSTFPPLTKEAKAGTPFDCDACGQSIVVTKSRLWKRHLIEDLKPYLCIYSTCSFSETCFPTRSAWIQHMERDHAVSKLVAEFTCPFCLEIKDGETHGILTHVSKHLEVISAISLPRNDPHDEMASDDDRKSTRWH